jgi:hypothetical protein
MIMGEEIQASPFSCSLPAFPHAALGGPHFFKGILISLAAVI